MKKLQLLSEIKDFTSLKAIIESDDWIIEQKIDGQRISVHVNRGITTAYNRKGVELTVPKELSKQFLPFENKSMILDGEYLNGIYYVFDVLSLGHAEVDYKPLKQRKILLRATVKSLKIPQLVNVRSASGTTDKASLIRDLKKVKAEGIVAKNLDAAYSYGNKTENMLKYKFYKTVDCVVGETWYNNKQAVQLLLKNEEETFIEVGKCKVVPGVLQKLEYGDVVEVKYLYATPSKRLYQPIFSNIRTDKHASECDINQLVGTCKNILVK